eukprot:1193415-Rhodomonas_salina.1
MPGTGYASAIVCPVLPTQRLFHVRYCLGVDYLRCLLLTVSGMLQCGRASHVGRHARQVDPRS